MIYYRRYIERFQLDTQDLSNAAVGIYDRLLDYYFGKEQPIPKTAAAGVARAVTGADKKALKLVLAQFFTLEKDGWHNKRADREIEIAKLARANGANGGRPPKDKGGNGADDETEDSTGGETGGLTGTGQSGSLLGSETVTGSVHPNKPTTLLPSQPKTLLPGTRAAPRPPPETGPTWDAYAVAYASRYGTQPVRNARVNGQIAALVKRLGMQESPKVAEFYLAHNRAIYVRSQHSVGLLLQDAEGLRTEWVRARPVSETEARNADRTMATASAFAPLIEEAEQAELLTKA